MNINPWLMILSALMLTACTHQSVAPPPQVAVQQVQPLLAELKQGVAIYFNKNSSEIEPQYNAYLSSAAKLLAQNPRLILEVDGHTDSSGSNAINRRVSQQRANMVQARLVTDYNVNPSQIRATGQASTQPIADNNTAEGRAKNRRVSLTLK
ncbi:OmpA family protein [Acinetobacter calcoaceticus]|uniref:OmpA family protein n=1 Tax=Acinetobacter calcoaceticus TaxID=471 RepID=A0A4R1XY38_ACICA|nr:OmpA family protein [Acinetobacter calcoaceticus]